MDEYASKYFLTELDMIEIYNRYKVVRVWGQRPTLIVNNENRMNIRDL